MEKVIRHDLKDFALDVNVKYLNEEYIKNKITETKINIIKLKFKRDDRNISLKDFFVNYYTRLYDLKLLSRFLLASKILVSENIKPVVVKRKETFLDYVGDNLYESKYFKVLYDGYIDSSFIYDEKELEFSQKEIEGLVSMKKLVLNPDPIKELEDQTKYNVSLPLNHTITLPHISENIFKPYDFEKLLALYPDITNKIRFSLTNEQIDKDVSNFEKTFLDGLDKKIDFVDNEKIKELDTITERIEEDRKALSKNRNLIKSIRSKNNMV